MKIDLEDVLDILKEYSSFKGGFKKIPPIKPGHGPCCTCQRCGYHHDECVCSHNEMLELFEAAIDRQIY